MESIFTAEKPIQISPVIKIFRFYFKNIGSFVPSLSSRLLWYLFTTPRPRTLRAIHTRLLKNSFKTDELIFEDLVLKVYHWGNPTGKKVLIVHGWESFAADHGRLIQELIKLGYHIIAPDMPAHGKSGGRQSHLPQFKTAALQIAQEFGPFHAVVGHSLGAVASTLMLCEYEKTEEVEKLISIGAAIDPIRFFAQFADFLALSDTLYHHFIQYSSRKINVDINAFDVHGIKEFQLMKKGNFSNRGHKQLSLKQTMVVISEISRMLQLSNWCGISFTRGPGQNHTKFFDDEVCGASGYI
jgi:esterase/lipase